MYEIAICDDDAAFAASFRELLTNALDEAGAGYRLTFFSNPDDLFAEIDRGRVFQLLFMDILFEKELGIQSAKILRTMKYPADIIFITTCSDYAVDGYEVFPLHYLVKPIDPDKLAIALNRFLEKHTPRTLHIVSSKKAVYIPIDEILYFEIYGHEIIIHKEDGTAETYVGTLKEIEMHLPPLTFVRPNRSYLVNLAKISRIARYSLQLPTGESIPISKRLYNQTQTTLINFADKQGTFF